MVTTMDRVIFDMDGIIFDSERLFMRELTEVLSEHGYEMTEDKYVQTLGLTGKALEKKVKSLFGEDYPHLEMSRITRNRVNDIAFCGGLPVKKGIKELLEYLKSKNISCAVASSTHSPYVEKYLETSGLRKYFDTVIGGEMAERSKPEPDIFLMALGNIKSENALVLEDSTNGILAAHRANIPVICIPDMVYPTDEVKMLTTAVLDNAADVISWLESRED